MTYYLMVALMSVVNMETQEIESSMYVFQEPYFYEMQECKDHVQDDLQTIFGHLYLNYGPNAMPQQIYCVDSRRLEEFMDDESNFRK